MNAAPVLQSIQVGKVTPLGSDRVPSGFIKLPVAGPVRVGKLNLEGDAQADLSVHGGPDKAVYGYAAAHYALWRADFPQHEAKFTPGSFGENLTISELDESVICAGDVHAIGTARLQVCQPRQPCFKFALRFDDERMPRAMLRSGRSGWYYHVIEEGIIKAGDTVSLADRPNPGIPFSELVTLVYWRRASPETLALIADAKGVVEWLRVSAARALRNRDQAASQ